MKISSVFIIKQTICFLTFLVWKETGKKSIVKIEKILRATLSMSDGKFKYTFHDAALAFQSFTSKCIQIHSDWKLKKSWMLHSNLNTIRIYKKLKFIGRILLFSHFIAAYCLCKSMRWSRFVKGEFVPYVKKISVLNW